MESQPGVFRTCLEFLDLENQGLVAGSPGENLGSSARPALAVTGAPRSPKRVPFPQTAVTVPAFD